MFPMVEGRPSERRQAALDPPGNCPAGSCEAIAWRSLIHISLTIVLTLLRVDAGERR
jgi:hypothetical protein